VWTEFQQLAGLNAKEMPRNSTLENGEITRELIKRRTGRSIGIVGNLRVFGCDTSRLTVRLSMIGVRAALASIPADWNNYLPACQK